MLALCVIWCAHMSGSQAAPLRAMAICVAGQYRTHAYTMNSLMKHVINVSSFDVVDVFYVLGMNDTGPLLPNRGVQRVDITPARAVRYQQFKRFEDCGDMMAATGMHYAHAIRTRPDILFVEDLRIGGLSDHVHAKLRCANREVYPSLHLHEIAQEMQTRLLKSCSPFVGCSTWSTILDDQFAVVPARYISAYFVSHHERTRETILTHTQAPYEGLAGGSAATLTRSLVDQGVEYKPLKLGFCLQRSRAPCRVLDDIVLTCSGARP